MRTATSSTPTKVGRKIPVRVNGPGQDEQLRKDRLTALVVLVIFAALLALMIWLASLGGGNYPPADPMHWPMM